METESMLIHSILHKAILGIWGEWPTTLNKERVY